MIKINNLRFCKHYMTCFDVMYISGGELWFGKYEHAVQPDSVYLFIKDINGSPLTLRRTEALCFYDESRDTWISQIDDNIYVEFSGFVSNTLKEMASFAIDELSGSETDISGSKSITNRIKNRFKFWFETKNRRINMINNFEWQVDPNGQINSDGLDAYLYFDKKACSEVKKTLNEIYGSRNKARYRHYSQYALPITPQPKFVQFNGDYTTVVWKDGSHTVVKRTEGEEYDEEKAILFAIVKHLCKDNGCEMSRYFDKFFKNERNINKED